MIFHWGVILQMSEIILDTFRNLRYPYREQSSDSVRHRWHCRAWSRRWGRSPGRSERRWPPRWRKPPPRWFSPGPHGEHQRESPPPPWYLSWQSSENKLDWSWRNNLYCNNGDLPSSASSSFHTNNNLLQRSVQTGLRLIKCLHVMAGTYVLNVTERRSIECLKLITSNPILQSSLSNSNIDSVSSG